LGGGGVFVLPVKNFAGLGRHWCKVVWKAAAAAFGNRNNNPGAVYLRIVRNLTIKTRSAL
jgi:hypothetical protein